jgi:iron complex outermembrane receptor protein
LTVARSTRAVENRLISFFGRANYSFKERYNLSFVLRRDGSTRFGPKNKWGLFPSLGLGWSVIDENFMAAFKNVISNLKFRAGYGITGNQGIGDFLYLPTYQQSDQYTQYQFGNEFYSTVRPSGYDENLKWEETTSLNLGLEFGLFDDKISGSFDYYEKNTNDLLFKRAVAAGANLTDILTTNVGKLRNRGVELSLSAIPVQTKKLKWTVGFNIARNKNQILALDGSDDPAFKGYQTGDISGGVGNTIQILKVGQPVNSFYVYKHKKDANGNPISDDFGRATLSDMYEDVSGPSQEKDGVVNENDRQPYKNPAAKYLYGLTSQVNFMNFDLNFTIRGSIGNYVYNNVASNQANYQRGGDNFVPNNMLTSVLETNFYAPQYFSDYYVEDASFLRMDNVSLGYSLKPFSQKMNFRIYGTIQNAFIITKYSGLDPEATISGIDNNIYPRSRTFIVGISVGL